MGVVTPSDEAALYSSRDWPPAASTTLSVLTGAGPRSIVVKAIEPPSGDTAIFGVPPGAVIVTISRSRPLARSRLTMRVGLVTDPVGWFSR
jgi:hypothetical protein